MPETLVRIEDLPELDLDAFQADPASALDSLRPQRIVRSVRGVELIGYEVAYEALADQRLRPMSAKDFASHGATPYIAEFVDQGVFLFMEPERHKEVRKIFARAFAAKKVLGQKDAIGDTANRLVDRLLDAGRGDLVDDFTQRFASEVLCMMLGFPPEDIPGFVSAALDLRHLVYVPMAPHIPKIEGALDSLRAYAVGLLAERRRTPQDDFLSALVDAGDSQGRLTTDEVVWGTVNLLLGGIDTTNFQLASSLQHLIANGRWDQAAADADVREAAIEEAMRLTPISTILGRIVHEPTVLDGVELPVGCDVKVNLVGAGRDPERFDDPHSYRLDRGKTYFPAVFGNGVHLCIGRNLAWQELRVAVERLTNRLRDLSFTAAPEMHSWTDAFYGPVALPVTFQARS